MTNPESNPWFIYGLPVDPEAPIYGLYEGMTETFFLVHHDREVLKEVALLFSSRYVLHICRLDVAENYEQNIIDNSVCGNWTISNTKDVPITRLPVFDRLIHVKQLIELPGRELPWNYAHDHTYLMAIAQWIDFGIRELKYLHQKQLEKYSCEYLDRLPGAPFRNRFLDYIERIREVIYQEFDFGVAETKITKLIAEAKESYA